MTFSPPGLVQKSLDQLATMGFEIEQDLESTVMMLRIPDSSTMHQLLDRFPHPTEDDLVVRMATLQDLENMVDVNERAFKYNSNGALSGYLPSWKGKFYISITTIRSLLARCRHCPEATSAAITMALPHPHPLLPPPPRRRRRLFSAYPQPLPRFVCFKSRPDDDKMLIQVLATDPHYEHRGHATALLLHAIQNQPQNTRIYLEVSETKAKSIYSNLGFEEVEIHQAKRMLLYPLTTLISPIIPCLYSQISIFTVLSV